jgi:Ca-activated chloride channel family protein
MVSRTSAFAAVGITSVLALGSLAAQQPVFRGSGDAVRVFVTVTDRDGRLVPGLGKDDFEVRDDGKPQALTLFDNTPQPVKLVVLLDVSGSMEGNLPLLRSAADALIAKLGDKDLARLGTFGRNVTISPTFTRDGEALRAALPGQIDPEAPTPLWRAIDDAMTAFGDAPDQRRAVLVLSDGKDSGPIGFTRRVVSQAEVIDRARADNVMIYGVGMRSRQRTSIPPGAGPGGLQAALLADLPDPGLARVAEESGGGYTEIRYGEDLAAAFARVVDELHSQYLLGYAPPARDGKVHKIDVRLGQKGLKARGQRSYVAPK